jgi:hypothetical protein
MERWQHGFMQEWQWPTITMFVMHILIWIYSAVRYDHFGEVAWEHTIMFVSDKIQVLCD